MSLFVVCYCQLPQSCATFTVIMSSTSTGNSAGRASDDQTGKSNVKFTGSCASCGIKEDGDTKFEICTACKSVRYCGVECQKKHRLKHKNVAKRRRPSCVMKYYSSSLIAVHMRVIARFVACRCRIIRKDLE